MLRQIVTPTAHAHSANTQSRWKRRRGRQGKLHRVATASSSTFPDIFHKADREREGYEIKPQRELPGVEKDRSGAAQGGCQEAQLLQLVTVGT